MRDFLKVPLSANIWFFYNMQNEFDVFFSVCGQGPAVFGHLGVVKLNSSSSLPSQFQGHSSVVPPSH